MRFGHLREDARNVEECNASGKKGCDQGFVRRVEHGRYRAARPQRGEKPHRADQGRDQQIGFFSGRHRARG